MWLKTLFGKALSVNNVFFLNLIFIKKLVIISVKSYKCVNIILDEIGGKTWILLRDLSIISKQRKLEKN